MKIFWENLFRKNPVFVLFLGFVPAVAVASSAEAGLALGLITGVILVLTTILNYFLSLLLPKNARTVGQLVVLIILTVSAHRILLTLNPQVVGTLNIFLPLLVANSLVIYSLQENDLPFGAVILDSIGKSLGFLLALVLIGIVREFFGYGTFFGTKLFTSDLPPLALASTVPGGMIIVGLLLALVNMVRGQGGELHD
ncbi:MAG: hypothetical protein GX335_02825 [Firmicutes bacterium]|nr:hypothetical protein [Bacillota bacterium]